MLTYRLKYEIVLKPDKSKPYIIQNIFSCKFLNNNFYRDLRNIVTMSITI